MNIKVNRDDKHYLHVLARNKRESSETSITGGPAHEEAIITHVLLLLLLLLLLVQRVQSNCYREGAEKCR